MEVLLAVVIVISFIASILFIGMTIVKALFNKGLTIKRIGILLAISFAIFIGSILLFDKVVEPAKTDQKQQEQSEQDVPKDEINDNQ